jgi:hypothetical protein
MDGAFTGCSATRRNISFLAFNLLIPVATQSKMWVWGLLLPGIAGSKIRYMNTCILLGVLVCYQVEISATGRSLVQRRPTLCDVFESYLDTSTMRRPTSTRAVGALRKLCNPLSSLNDTNIFMN